MAPTTGFFSFPDPVNETAARVVAGGVVGLAAATVALDQPWLLAPLTYGFAARVLAGPKVSPLGQLATRVVVPCLPVEHRYVAGPPKRLAQGMGLAVTAAASVAWFGFGRKRAAYRLLKVLMVAAGLESVLGFCVACRVFPLLAKLGLVSPAACEDCVGGRCLGPEHDGLGAGHSGYHHGQADPELVASPSAS